MEEEEEDLRRTWGARWEGTDIVRGEKGGSHVCAAGRSTRTGPRRQSSLRRDRGVGLPVGSSARESKTARKKVVPDRG